MKSFIEKGKIRNAIQIELTIFSSTDLDMDVEISTECYLMVEIHQEYQYLYDHRIKRIDDEETFSYDSVCSIVSDTDDSDEFFSDTESKNQLN